MSQIASEARIALAIARKDAVAELRGRHAIVSTLFFAALVLLLFGFALGPDAERLAQAAPGLLWLAIVFAGVLALGRLHQLEADDGALEQLALFPIPRRTIYLGKALAGFAAMLVMAAILLGAAAVLYDVDIVSGGAALVAILVLGTLGVAAVGTFHAGVTVRLRAREAMLPLLMLPVLAPLLLAAVKATSIALGAGAAGELVPWLELLIVFDGVMLVAGAATYGYLMEE
jgi:heme exporter protein B